MRAFNAAIFALCGLSLGWMAPRSEAAQLTAIVDVTVISMSEAGVLTNHTVLIEDERIVSVVPSAQARIAEGTNRIEAKGKFLIPGLMDMHVHVGLRRGPRDVEPQTLEQIAQDELFLYVANGVTTVRNMQGSSYHLKMRERIARGELLGPRLYTAGPFVDGVPPTWPSGHRILVKGADVHGFIRDYMDEGYDFLKTYTNLPDDVYEELLAEAQRMGVRVVGHVPASASLNHAFKYHKSSIEHLLGYDRVMQPKGAPEVTGRAYSGWPTVEHSQMPVWAEKAAAAGVWQCPTLVTLRNLGDDLGDEPGLSRALAAPGMEFVSPVRKAMWRASPLHAAANSEFRRMLRAGQANRERMVNVLHKAGAPLMIGTDATAVFVVPGYSVATELENFVAAGLSPHAALAAATRAPARYLNQGADLGVVRSGAIADLVLLEQNPLESIGAVRAIAGVVLKGRWMARSSIDERLQEIRRRNDELQQQASLEAWAGSAEGIDDH